MYSTLPVNPLLAVLLSSARGGFTASGVRRIDRRIQFRISTKSFEMLNLKLRRNELTGAFQNLLSNTDVETLKSAIKSLLLRQLGGGVLLQLTFYILVLSFSYYLEQCHSFLVNQSSIVFFTQHHRSRFVKSTDQTFPPSARYSSIHQKTASPRGKHWGLLTAQTYIQTS